MDEYFAEWNKDHTKLFLIYKKIRPVNLPEDMSGDGVWLNYIYPDWAEIIDDSYKERWFIVDVIYSSVKVDYPNIVIARIDLKHDKNIKKISYSKAIAMIL